jgi:hypothetical protein
VVYESPQSNVQPVNNCATISTSVESREAAPDSGQRRQYPLNILCAALINSAPRPRPSARSLLKIDHRALQFVQPLDTWNLCGIPLVCLWYHSGISLVSLWYLLIGQL